MLTARTSSTAVPGAVWKFGYGSNMSPDFLRMKKAVNPLVSERTILRGWRLSFPRGHGLDFVEPSFATLRRDPDGLVHGVSMLFSLDDARKLDAQEGSYDVQPLLVTPYGSSAETMEVEVYTPRNELPADHPECCCSARYRDILVKGATEMELAAEWLAKLHSLPIYTPSAHTLAARAQLPSPSELPAMTVAELAQHDGSHPDKPVYSSACGYGQNMIWGGQQENRQARSVQTACGHGKQWRGYKKALAMPVYGGVYRYHTWKWGAKAE